MKLMAIVFSTWSQVSFSHAMIFILFANFVSSSMSNHAPCYPSIVSFGNSLSDTGNLPLLTPPCMPPNSVRPPYGRTFFNRPTGRFSDGRLIIDFIAERLRLPYVPPYIALRNANFSGCSYEAGVNFAVTGDTVLDQEFYASRLISNPRTNVSLGDEMKWLRQFLATIPDGCSFLQRSLVLAGSLGANDYGFALVEGRSLQEVQSYVPLVVDEIGLIIREMISLGARSILVPGLLPFGCSPAFLTVFRSSNKADYDPKTGCLIWLNKFCQYHNELLQDKLSLIRELYPKVSLGYADYYNNALRIFRSPKDFGFTNANQSCCGVGGKYKFNLLLTCGTPPLNTSCDDPSRYVHWDGTHYTEAAYRIIAQGTIDGSYVVPRINLFCNETCGSYGPEALSTVTEPFQTSREQEKMGARVSVTINDIEIFINI